jgi:hypothetical protein
MKLPTSDLPTFMKQLNNPNTCVKGELEIQHTIQKIQKNFVLAYPSDSTGCGHIRCIFPFNYMNSHYGNNGDIFPVISPVFLYQEDVLTRTRSIFFQRTMNVHQLKEVERYKALQKKYKFKMIYDLDDFIWDGKDSGECLPNYNMACTKIGTETKEMSIKIMNLMDLVCVSTEFLKDYLINVKKVTTPIEVVQNTVSKYFWSNQGRRAKIKTMIEKPRVIYTGSPSHYCNVRHMKGDWENAWCEWVVKSVKNNEIEFLCMGGLPFFFESIKNKIHIINWVNSYQYHTPIIRFKPDFGLSPLVPNYFNYAKSNLKLLEYGAVGAVSIGTVFTNGKPSPYDGNPVKVPDNITVEGIDELFNFYREPENFNSVIDAQYQILDKNGHWTESEDYINKLARLL